MVVRAGGMLDNEGNPSRRFWGFFLVLWIVLGVASLVVQAWWGVGVAAYLIWFAARRRRDAQDRPR
jgi:hypothetical protein